LYELESFCTSIVAKKTDGTIIHGRVLDFDFPDQMRPITFQANYVKNGQPIFESMMFAGTVGIYTGFKEGKFSISEN
jgi:penicillin V acylase-like amidase (Ntn superfamily)